MADLILVFVNVIAVGIAVLLTAVASHRDDGWRGKIAVLGFFLFGFARLLSLNEYATRGQVNTGVFGSVGLLTFALAVLLTFAPEIRCSGVLRKVTHFGEPEPEKADRGRLGEAVRQRT